MIVFFVASPAASAAYLTVSETFPIEIRAVTIAIFYAIGTGIGGVAAPFVFGKLIASGSRESVFAGYVFAAALMLGAAVVAALFAVAAERQIARGRRDAAVGGGVNFSVIASGAKRSTDRDGCRIKRRPWQAENSARGATSACRRQAAKKAAPPRCFGRFADDAAHSLG